ncbi:PMT_2 domain-containing protein [Paraburkholderia tropica]|uniref:glycosyltransferase family 39 protein n=1 Tax=Paraburkholderia tropica TaxID=92647 RepID=UPI001CAF3A5B|nr:glycosyltransferase family 39 protein [Paraburkholderia tropica]CAG9226967.1 PMT_2 domain-containing protein [Paraburkholderia tropica]
MMQSNLSINTEIDSPTHSVAKQKAAWLLALLPVNAIVWTIGAWLSRGNLDIPGDMVENYVWGIEWQAGYAKHPPFFAWITALWFQIFPHTDLAYFALSALNAMVGLFGIVALARRFLPWWLAAVAGLAMAVSPLYSTLSIKFNANAVLLSLWPWTAYLFVRFMQSGKWHSALALGALAGAAVLGKYFSVVLLIALLMAAFARPRWRSRVFSWQSLIVVAAGFIVLLPHLVWLVEHQFQTFEYAAQRTSGSPMAVAMGRFSIYTLAQIGYLLPSFVFVILLVKGARVKAAKQMLASCISPRMYPDLWVLTFGPFMVIGIIAIAAKAQMASVWGMAEWFAVVPMWVCVLFRMDVSLRVERSMRVLIVYWMLVLIGTAAVGYAGARRNTDDAAEPRAELADAARAIWKRQSGQDTIPVVSGSVHEAQSVAFYSGGRTRYWDLSAPRTTPWLRSDDVRREGMLIVCRRDDASCHDEAKTFSHALATPIDIRRRAWGMTLPARQYAIYVLPPASSS